MSKTASSPVISSAPGCFKLRKAAWIGLGLLGLVFALVLVAPHFIDLGLFKRTYLPLLEESFNRRIDVGEVHLSLLPTPSIRLSQLTVSESAALPPSAFFSVRQIRLKLKFLPLLRGRFEITELVLDKPVFNLLKGADGSINIAGTGGKTAAANIRRDAGRKIDTAKPAESAALPLILPKRMRVQDGELNLATPGLAPINIKGIDLSLREFTGAAPFPFRLAFDYPGLKTISLEGQIDYQEETAFVQLINNRLTVRELTLPVEGNITHLTTTPRIDLRLGSESVEVQSLLQVLATLGLAPRDVEMSGPMKLSMSILGPANGLVTHVRGLFKDVKVQSKRAVRGHLSGEVDFRLPLGGGPIGRRVQGAGKIAAHRGELTNADLIKKIHRVTGMIGFSQDQRRQATTFERLETEFSLRGGLADFSRIYLVNPQLEAQGKGTMTLESPTLDLAINAALSAQASARAGRPQATAYFKNSQGRVVVPLRIKGPLEGPTVGLDGKKFAESKLPPSVEKKFASFLNGLLRDR